MREGVLGPGGLGREDRGSGGEGGGQPGPAGTPLSEDEGPSALPRVIPREPLLRDDGRGDAPPGARALLAGALAAAALGLGWALLDAPDRVPLLPGLVDQALPDSGVSNPVTAVLLNFRSYDTLLEVVVLLVAMVGIWSMDRGARRLGRERGELVEDPVLRGLARLVAPLAAVVAVHLTWAGSSGTGGAFQAGALLAGAGVFLAAAGFLHPPSAHARPVRALAASGLYLFVAVGFGSMPWSGAFLGYPPGWAYPLILGVEALLTLSIAVVLVEYFVDVPAVPERDPALDTLDPTGDPLGRVLDTEGRLLDREGEGP